ncbi:FKBP-type peptidyl-prolyl cis-trans isomerase [Hymenobacter actinosclerus]|uniref:Peptidyl-prolyl cis-trans isomerase n=1 Tax=Hymenobacter actinosclerus TaxID=82805 RepID=A0A1I0HKM2_9BACT|nr:FKBP-type peptidyl-prolyl cis-trans isomerase [Hymenobacter actinosclerus]SET83634.1 FKBP-type peptidyl-prolyl cis-trans isomerase [Hymenobacter actinosclerus]
MKKLTLLLSLLTLLVGGALVGGCKQPTNPYTIDPKLIEAQKKADDDTIQAYLTRHAIKTYRRLDSGIYLVPVTDGPAANPLIKAGQKVTVNYVGKFINKRKESQVFEASSANRTDCGCYTFYVGQASQQAPTGVQQAITEMRQGDRKQMLIPSYLAYDFSGAGAVPASTPVLFDEEILSVE